VKRFAISFLTTVIAFSLVSCGMFRPANEPAGIGSVTDAFVSTEPTSDTEVPGTVTTAPEKEPVTTATKASFLGCGDNIIYYGNIRDAAGKSSAGRQYGFAYSYEKVSRYITGADIAFINQETLMCGEGYEISYYPHFNSPRDLGYDLVDVGFDVVNIANNHMMDKGPDGLAATIEFWKSLPVTLIGGYTSEEDFNTVRYHEKNGLKIAFLSYADHTNGLVNYGKNVWVPYLDEKDTGMTETGIISDEATETIMSQVSEARENADFVIVSVHWGTEGRFVPSEEQKKYAQIMADMGVDVIVGHHPHVIQPVEWIDRADGGRTLCAYSLGNFMAEQDDDFEMVGGMISFDMVRDEYGVCAVENPVFIPTVFWFDGGFYNNTVWPMEEISAEMVAAHGISNYGNYTSLERLKKYVTDTISPEFLPDSIKN